MSTPQPAKRPASPDGSEEGNAHKRAREDTTADATSATKTEDGSATAASNGSAATPTAIKAEGETNGNKVKDAASAEKNKADGSKKKMEDSNMDGWVLELSPAFRRRN